MFISNVGGSAAVSSASGGKVTKVSNVSTTASVVIGANPQRKKLVFHNPGTINIYVAPSIDANGAALALATNNLGGSFLIFADGGTLSLDAGEIQGAWQAISASAADNPLTVMDSNV